MTRARLLLVAFVSLILATLACISDDTDVSSPSSIAECAVPNIPSGDITSSRFKPSPIESDFAWDVPIEAWARLGRGDARSLALSPDGTQVVVGSSIGIESFTLINDEFERQWYDTLDAPPHTLTISADGQYIAGQIGASDLALWHAESGELAFSISPSTACSVASPVWAPESAQLAYGAGGDVFVWDGGANQITEVAYEPTGNVTALTWSHDAASLAIGATGGVTQIVRLPDQQTTATFDPTNPDTAAAHDVAQFRSALTVSDLGFGQDDQTLVVGLAEQAGSDAYRHILLWDVISGKTTPIPAGSNPLITTQDSPLAIAYDFNAQSLVVYNTADGSVHTSLLQAESPYFSAYTAAADANTVAAIVESDGKGSTVEVWNLDEGQFSHHIDGFGGYGAVMWLSNDELAVSAPANLILRWSLTSGSSQIAEVLQPAESGRMASDFSRYVLYEPCQSMMLLDISGEFIAETSVPCSTYGVWAISGDATHAALIIDRETVKLIDFDAGGQTQDITLSPASMGHYMALSPDGSLLVVGHEDWSISLWDTASGQKVGDLPVHDEIVGLRFNADGTLLAVQTIAPQTTPAIVVYEVPSGEKLQTLTGTSYSRLESIAFDPQSQRLAGVGYEYVVIWDMSSGEIIQTLSTGDETDLLRSLSWSPDGKSLATVSDEQGVMIWRLSD